MVSTKTAVGSIGILAHHQPLLAMLDPTELRLYKTEGECVRFAQAEGYLQMAGEPRPDPGRGGARARRSRRGSLRERFAAGRAGARRRRRRSEKRRVAERDKTRLEAFSSIAEGGS